ncbi:hypothetical protein BpHYR1_008541 [Brachionus plicatilis]|uniref:Uncharacterized protein n=1 Tax=Brachionus plicatilis TaxID=10195 RepID=A0A3M7T5C8_BRAPC|nr:hypothetical protein BpHYR1_008541 [Brachionus plicatilis]
MNISKYCAICCSFCCYRIRYIFIFWSKAETRYEKESKLGIYSEEQNGGAFFKKHSDFILFRYHSVPSDWNGCDGMDGWIDGMGMLFK